MIIMGKKEFDIKKIPMITEEWLIENGANEQFINMMKEKRLINLSGEEACQKIEDLYIEDVINSMKRDKTARCF